CGMRLWPDHNLAADLASSVNFQPPLPEKREVACNPSHRQCHRALPHQGLHPTCHQQHVKITFGGASSTLEAIAPPGKLDLIALTSLASLDLPLFMIGCTVTNQGTSIV
ncbi:hypothetical protein L1887_17368, partial [Cichorium endivia]